jgi:hypothetical protein
MYVSSIQKSGVRDFNVKKPGEHANYDSYSQLKTNISLLVL